MDRQGLFYTAHMGKLLLHSALHCHKIFPSFTVRSDVDPISPAGSHLCSFVLLFFVSSFHSPFFRNAATLSSRRLLSGANSRRSLRAAVPLMQPKSSRRATVVKGRRRVG